MEVCEQYHTGIRRVFDTAPSSATSVRSVRRAMTSETDMFEMCGQYMIMSFFSQNAALIKNRSACLSLKNPINDLGHLVLIQDPLFEDIKDCLSQTSIFPTNSDSSSFAFCVLCQKGDFSDPLLLLPEILNCVTTLGGVNATKICSHIRKPLKWKADSLLNQDLRVEAAETCPGVIGAFNEVFGFQNAETQKLRKHVREIIFKPEFASQGTAKTLANDNHSKGLMLPYKRRSDTSDEEGFLRLIAAGDFNEMRTSLLLLGNGNPDILSKLLRKAYFVTQGSLSFEHTEIIRLLILSGSGCESYCFNNSALMDFAVEVGYIPLAELLMKKGKQKKGTGSYNHSQFHTAIKNGYEDLVKVLLKSGGNVNAQDSNGLNALCVAALHDKIV